MWIFTLFIAPTPFLTSSSLRKRWYSSLATPATEPSVFFQNRIVEPKDVESVPSAAYLLSTAFDDEPFLIQYRGNSGYLTVEEDKLPLLDLSVLKNIDINESEKSIKVDAGVTVLKLATVLKKIDDISLLPLKDLLMVLPANSQLSVVEAALDERYDKLQKVIKEVHVVDKTGTFISKQLTDINE